MDVVLIQSIDIEPSVNMIRKLHLFGIVCKIGFKIFYNFRISIQIIPLKKKRNAFRNSKNELYFSFHRDYQQSFRNNVQRNINLNTDLFEINVEQTDF